MRGSVAGEIELSNYYRRIAEHYIALAEAEETRAGNMPRPKDSTNPNRLGAWEKEVAN